MKTMTKKMAETLTAPLSTIDSLVCTKYLGLIKNHDGTGEKIAVYIALPNRTPILFSMETDYWSGDMVKSSPIANISLEDFEKLTMVKFQKVRLTKEHKILQDNNESLKLFEASIKDLNLDCTFGDITTLEDFIVTLSLKNGKVKHNKS